MTGSASADGMAAPRGRSIPPAAPAPRRGTRPARARGSACWREAATPPPTPGSVSAWPTCPRCARRQHVAALRGRPAGAARRRLMSVWVLIERVAPEHADVGGSTSPPGQRPAPPIEAGACLGRVERACGGRSTARGGGVPRRSWRDRAGPARRLTSCTAPSVLPGSASRTLVRWRPLASSPSPRLAARRSADGRRFWRSSCEADPSADAGRERAAAARSRPGAHGAARGRTLGVGGLRCPPPGARLRRRQRCVRRPARARPGVTSRCSTSAPTRWPPCSVEPCRSRPCPAPCTSLP